LYLYIGQRLLAGDVPYVDAWDQKPPLVYAIYATLWSIWPHASVVALADLLAAAGTAWLLVAIGRRTFGARTGAWAAALFLIGSHPGLSRLGGVYVRGQCEVFISFAVAAALLPLAHERRTVLRALLAGLWLGAAIWLKFNAAAYVLPVAAAAWGWGGGRQDLRGWTRDLIAAATGVVFVSAIALTWFAAHDALDPLKLATIDYNIAYSSAAYAGTRGPLVYLAKLPIERGGVDLLWFLGGAGALALVVAGRRAPRGSAIVVLAWIAAAMIAIAINARNLPQYFVQAAPALACAAAIGGALFSGHAVGRWLVLATMAAGLWRVGVSDRQIRFGGSSGAVRQSPIRSRLRPREHLTPELPLALPRRAEVRCPGDRRADDAGADDNGGERSDPGVRFLTRRLRVQPPPERVAVFLELPGRD
jgi:hypothetical protein